MYEDDSTPGIIVLCCGVVAGAIGLAFLIGLGLFIHWVAE